MAFFNLPLGAAKRARDEQRDLEDGLRRIDLANATRDKLRNPRIELGSATPTGDIETTVKGPQPQPQPQPRAGVAPPWPGSDFEESASDPAPPPVVDAKKLPAPTRDGVPFKSDPKDPAYRRWAGRISNEAEYQQRLLELDRALLHGTDDTQGLGAGNLLYGWVMDNVEEAAERASLEPIAEWYRKHADTFFRENPEQLEAAISLGPVAVWRGTPATQKYTGLGTQAAAPRPGLKVPAVKPAQPPVPVATQVPSTIPRVKAAVDGLSAALKTPQTKYLLKWAKALGISPADALATYAMESSLGMDTSPTARDNPLQVQDQTYTAMKWYFKENGQYHKRPDADPRIIQFASTLSKTPEGRMGAGLLRLKYAQLIGVPSEHLGAAYHANADQVLAQGGPLDTHDGRVTNTEHNTLFNDIRARYRAILSGPTEVVPRPAKTDEEAKKAAKDRTKAVTAAVEPEIEATKKEAGVLTKGAVADALTKKKPPEPKFMTGHLLNKEYQAGLGQWDALKYQASIYRRAGLGDKYAETQMQLMVMKSTMVHLGNQKAVDQFENGNDPRLLQQRIRAQTGRNVLFVPQENGKWTVQIDGQTTHEDMTRGQIVTGMRRTMSSEYNASINAAEVKAQSATQELFLENALAIRLKQWDGYNQRTKEEITKLYNLEKVEGYPGHFIQTLENGAKQLIIVTEEKDPGEDGGMRPTILRGPTISPPPGSDGLVTAPIPGGNALLDQYRLPV
jgi:hypothetical protein